LASNAQGYVIIEQQSAGFQVTRYHDASGRVLESFLVPR